MKKIIAFITALAAVLPSAAVGYAENENKADEALEIVTGLGLIEYADSEDTISRGDFAAIIYNMLSEEMTEEKSSWEESFFGDRDEEMKLIGDTQASKAVISEFMDVTAESEYYDAVMYGTDMGIFNGVDRGSFVPNDNLTLIQAVKSLLAIMGYGEYAKMNGGYPAGYINLASSLGMLDGLTRAPSKEITYSELAKLLYNTFDVSCMEINEINSGRAKLTADNTKTFLNKFLEMDYIDGIVFDNGIYALDGLSTISVNEVKIGDTVLDITEEQKRIVREMTGKNVRAFYSVEDDEILVYMHEKNDTSLIIDAKEIDTFANNTITYTDGTKTRNVRVETGACMIFNGAYKDSYTAQDFIFNHGSVRLVKSKRNGNYDCIIIESYASWFVGSVDYNEKIIYNEASDSSELTDDSSVDLSEIINYGEYDIYNSDKEILTFEEIKNNAVIDFYTNGKNYVKMICTDIREENAEITGNSRDEYDRAVYLAGDKSFTASYEFEHARKAPSIVMRSVYVFYMNSFGEVVWAVAADDNYYDLDVIYVIGCIKDEDEEKYFVKYVNDKGVSGRLELYKKVLYGDISTLKRDDYINVNAEKIYQDMSNYTGIAAIDTNSKNQIKMLELPYNGKTKEKRLQVMYDTTTSSWPRIRRSGAYAYLTREAWASASTVIWQSPVLQENKKDASMYTMASYTAFPSNGAARENLDVNLRDKNVIKCYNINGGSVFAKWIDYSYEKDKLLNFDDSEYFVVTNITSGLNSDDEPTVVLDGYKVGGNTQTPYTLYSEEAGGVTAAGVSCNPALSATSFYDIYQDKNVTHYAVKKGDIIKYTYNEDDRYPTKIAILYRQGEEKFFTGTDSSSQNWQTDRTNPFVVDYTCNWTGRNPTTVTDERIYTLGYVYNIEDQAAEVTTSNLREGVYNANASRVFYPVSGNNGVVIDYSTKEIKVTSNKGYGDELKAYTDYGSRCSKLITVHSGYVPLMSFMIID